MKGIPSPPRDCDWCEAPGISPRCVCNEAYCSRECQGRDLKTHQTICETVRENNRVALTMNAVYWNELLGGTPEKRRK